MSADTGNARVDAYCEKGAICTGEAGTGAATVVLTCEYGATCTQVGHPIMGASVQIKWV